MAMDEHGRAPNPRYLDGAKLRRLRLEAGLDQAALADKAGTSQTQISHHELGDWGCHMKQLAKYAKALGVKPKALMLDSALNPAQAGEAAATAA